MSLPEKIYVTQNSIDDSPYLNAQLSDVEAVENYDGEDAAEVGIYKLVKVARYRLETKTVEVV